jgi:glycosyltransferase involved in cell wall biosynthesis
MLAASIIICTHNPRKEYLERTLKSLREQALPRDLWELVVVDNLSSRPVAKEFDLSWHPRSRHLLEQEIGLSSARQRGIKETSGGVLIFVDDDNVLAPDYLVEALGIASGFPFLGVWGSGSIVPEFEVEPKDHLKGMLIWLAVRDVEKPVWSNSISFNAPIPFGAGLCVRRNIGEAYLEFYKTSSIKIAGRKGQSLGGHEDFEICYLACRDGLGMGIFPELKIVHLISKNRVTDEHFVKLVEGGTMSKLLLEYKWTGAVPRSPFCAHGLASMMLNLLTKRGFWRKLYFAELRAVIGARRRLALEDVGLVQ